MAPLPYDDNRVTYMAETDARNRKLKFGIKAKDRTRHIYVIGKTGMGKSTLLENMAVQDIQNGEGMAFIDPHGKTTDLLMEYVPKERIKDVVYIAPFDVEYPISFNVLEAVDRDKRHLVVSGLMSTFKKIWEDAWSARMEYILTNTLLALLEYPGATLLGVNRMLSDKAYRTDVVSYIQDPSVKAFWVKEFANYTERQAAEAVPAIQNKVGQFTANPLIRNMIGQSKSSFSFRDAMDNRKIMIINLSKGKIGDENMKLLGGLLVTKLYLAAMSRADVPDRVLKGLPNFYLFVDEFQNFANASFADILSEARKYKLNLTIAHQYVEQMEETVAAAVFGNVGTMISFRVGATDAEKLEKEFAPVFTMEDLVNLGFAQIYLKLMIDGLTSPPFSATTLGPIAHPDTSYVNDIIDASRQQFAQPRESVEAEIVKFHEPTAKPSAPKATAKTVEAPVASAAAPSAAPVKPAAPVAPTTPKSVPSAAPVATPKSVRTTSPTPPPTQSPFVAPPPKPTTKSPEKTAAPFPSLDGGHTSLAEALKMITNIPPQKVAEEVSVPEPVAPKPAPAPVAKSSAASSVAKSAPVVKSSAAPAPKPAVKPVPLSTLAPKPAVSAKPDPKKQSPENVNDLKKALAAALGKPPTSSRKEPVSSNKVNPSTKTAEPNGQTASDPTEVPEDVLKKILQV